VLTITKQDKSKPHVVTDNEGKRTHYLGEVRMEIAADRLAVAANAPEEVKSNV